MNQISRKQIQLSAMIGLILFIHLSSNAQATISPDNTTGDPSAMLDIQSSEKGFLMPRMTEDERTAISSPTNGLLYFQTDNSSGFKYNEGDAASPEWRSMIAAEDIPLYEKRIAIESIPITINESGSYYLTQNLESSTSNGDGITIDIDNVTIDLNGFSIYPASGISSDDGIFISGSHENIVIKNGSVHGWGGDGINALNADMSYFEDLIVYDNEGDGIVSDFSCIIFNCVAKGNELDGLEGDDGVIIYNCTASYNGDNGIQTSEGSLVVACTSLGNETDGVDVGSGSKVEYCTSYDNGSYGIDLALCGQVINSKAYKNGYNGFDIASSSLVMNNIANNNGVCLDEGTCNPSFSSYGVGIRTFANSMIINNSCFGNYVGIYVASTDVTISGNNCQNNGLYGIRGSASGGLFINNSCEGNGNDVGPFSDTSIYSDPGNYRIETTSTYGPIIDVSNLGDLSGNSSTNNPYVNFSY